MRKIALVLLVFAITLSASAATKRFEARSDRHALTLDVDDNTYRVNVIEVPNNSVILSATFPIDSKEPMNAVSKLPDGEVRVMLRVLNPPAVSATVDILKDGKVVDSFASAWSTAPRPRATSVYPDPNSVLGPRYPDVPHIDGNKIKAPVVIKRVEPFYSEEARRARVSGIVILETLVDRNGDVKDVAVLKPLPFDLGPAAVEAVRQWKFRPATMDGQPVDVLFNLTVHFKLE